MLLLQDIIEVAVAAVTTAATPLSALTAPKTIELSVEAFPTCACCACACVSPEISDKAQQFYRPAPFLTSSLKYPLKSIPLLPPLTHHQSEVCKIRLLLWMVFYIRRRPFYGMSSSPCWHFDDSKVVFSVHETRIAVCVQSSQT